MDTPSKSPLRSAFYACRVVHARFRPKSHSFSYRLFYLAIDLDELDQLHGRLLPFSVNHGNLLSFWEDDHLPLSAPVHNQDTPLPCEPPLPRLKQRVLAYCRSQGVDLGEGARVTLITLPRVLGHAFNPVSFHVCHDAAGQLRCVIAEVMNTYREVKPYLLPRITDVDGAGACGARHTKHFYVSPFSGLETAFDFLVREPGSRLSIRIDDHEGGHRVLHSSLSGRAEPLGSTRLLAALFRFPAVTLRVLVLIHWQAFRLWLKRVPHFRKADRPDLQRDVRHPHASLKPHSLA
jgi:DUF1365 family protein